MPLKNDCKVFMEAQFEIICKYLNNITKMEVVEQAKRKKGPPFYSLPNKQIMPLQGLGTTRVQNQKIFTDILRKGLQVGGCKHIDTARLYNNQIPLGNAIKTVITQGRVKRQELFVATKIFNLKGQSVQRQVKEGLQLMQLKYFDLLYLHWPYIYSEELGQFNHKPLEEIWPQMLRYVKHLGVSNFNGQLIMQLLSICRVKPVALQIQVHPYLPNTALVELAQRNGIAVIAYCPLVRGNNLKKGDGVNILKEQVILELAYKHSKTPAQILLMSLLQRGIGVIPKTTKPSRLQQNYDAWKFELSQDDFKRISVLSRGYRVCDALRNVHIFD